MVRVLRQRDAADSVRYEPKKGPAQKQTQRLFSQKPAKDWRFQEWVRAMQDALFQIDAVLESRMWFHEVKLMDPKEFQTFAREFKDHVALIERDSKQMAQQDQIYCFRRALRDTLYFNLTQIDDSTNKPFVTLDALMEKCRAVYQGRLGESHRQGAGTLSGQRGRNARRHVVIKGHRGKAFVRPNLR